MRVEVIGGLLLPVGVWLILSAATPPQLHRRLAAASLIAIAVATLTFVVCGYAFMFGAALPGAALPGASGFFLDGATTPEGLERFVRYWPLIIACALLIAGTLAPRARTVTQIALITLISGVLLPVTGRWVWAGGWRADLGSEAGWGQGTIDLGHLSVVGLIAGAASIAWLTTLPRRALTLSEPELPAVQFPVRAVTGALCVLTSTVAYAGTYVGASVPSSTVALGQFVNSSISVSAAILTAGLYTLFTTRRTDVLSASRAAMAATFAASSGGALLPMGGVIVLGIGCGLLATIGFYAVNERLRWHDDSAIVTSAFLPSALGALATGLFANGAFGITGLFAAAATDRTAGLDQLFAQVVGLGAAAALAWVISSAMLGLLRRAGITLCVSTEVDVSTHLPADQLPASIAAGTSDYTASLPEVQVTYTPPPEPSLASITQPDYQTMQPSPEPTPPNVTKSRRDWLSWLRRSPAPPTTPRQPRKVAYPYRAGGRRLAARPLTIDESESYPDAESPTLNGSG